jgi:kumamolisin
MTTFMALARSAHSLLPNSQPAGPIDLSEGAGVTVFVRSKGDLAALEARAREEARKPPGDRSYLSREEVAEQYGASESDMDLLEQYAKEHGLTTESRSAERSMVLRGTLGNLLAAFPADVQLYNHPGGDYRGRQGEILIPEQLSGIVKGVIGFDTRPRRRSRPGIGPGEWGFFPSWFFDSVPGAPHYNFPKQLDDVTLDGKGQAIGIISLGGGFTQADVALYFVQGNHIPNVVAVPVDDGNNAPGTSGSGEVMLDIDMAGSVAPAATIAVYFAPNSGDQGFIDAISAAIHDRTNRPAVISISWGSPETLTDQHAMDQFHDLFIVAAVMGITICVASGDHGAADMDAKEWDGKLHVDHPACDPLVLGCGGTDAKNTPLDVVWNDGTAFDPTNPDGGGGWASGGGVSELFPVPDYQASINPVSLSGEHGRGVPDLSMNAIHYLSAVGGVMTVDGGTSAVAPLMAGLVARFNQALSLRGKKPAGFLNPFLYSHSTNGMLASVLSGNNGIANTISGYEAGPGWNACCGLGTPDGTAMLNALLSM